MNIEQPQATFIWAKLVAIQPENQNIALSNGRAEDQSDAKFTIDHDQYGQAFIQNISTSSLYVDDNLLEIGQEKQLFGGEKLSFEQDNDHIKTKRDYIFCFVNFHPDLKRDRDEVTESQSLQKLAKIENDLQRELTCSICTNSLEVRMVLSPCLHSFCSFCLFDHLKLSSQCPLCRVEAVSVAKSSVLSNVIQLAIDHFPTLQRPELEEINYGGVIVRNEQSVYIGSYQNGKKNGQGKFIWKNGYIYEGSWKNNKREGKGVSILRNGDRYEGFWMDDHYNGFGKYTWSFGQEYEGDFQNNTLHGYGVMKYQDGKIYKGEWKNNKREGKGALYYPCGDRYDGSWMNDFFNGTGKFTWSTGQEYEGNFKDGSRNGYGRMKYTDGKVYLGEWKYDKRVGKGLLTLKNGDVCEGKWVNDVLQPMVTVKYSTGERYFGEIQVESYKKFGREIKIGSFERHGKGVLTLQNGKKYTGDWKSEVIHKRFTINLKEKLEKK